MLAKVNVIDTDALDHLTKVNLINTYVLNH